MDGTDAPRGELERELERLHEASFGWALSCCGWNDADAEDVLQTTYMKVVSGRARFGGRSAFRTWLFGVIRQTAREQRRRERSQVARAELAALEPVAAPVAAGDEVLERAARAEGLRAALAELPARQREVLHLVFYEDLTIREAAEVMDVSLGSARVHYERGKAKLRVLLAAGRPGAEDA